MSNTEPEPFQSISEERLATQDPPDDTGGGVPGGVDTPDPFGRGDQSSYAAGATPNGPDMAETFLPPWSPMRAPGTRKTIAPGAIVPINPWLPVVALLDAQQLAMLNRNQAARQAAAMYPQDSRTV